MFHPTELFFSIHEKQDEYLIFTPWMLLIKLLLSKHSIPVQHGERMPKKFVGKQKSLSMPKNLCPGGNCLRVCGLI